MPSKERGEASAKGRCKTLGWPYIGVILVCVEIIFAILPIVDCFSLPARHQYQSMQDAWKRVAINEQSDGPLCRNHKIAPAHRDLRSL